VLRQWLDHRREVLARRSRFRLAEIERRLEVFKGYIIVFLNLHKVIRLIRKEDEPKIPLMKAVKFGEKQADAILNMRLRSLRKLEETEVKREHETLTKERKEISVLLASPVKQWKTIADQLKELARLYAADKRRTSIEQVEVHDIPDISEAL